MQIESVQIEFLSCDAWHNTFQKQPPADVIFSKASTRLSLIQNKTSCMTACIDGGALFDVPEGGFVIFPPQKLQYCKVPAHAAQNAQIRWFYIYVTVNGKYSFTDLFEPPDVLPKKYTREMDSHLTALLNLKDMPDRLCDRLSIAYKIVQILLDVSRPKSKTDNSVQKALSYIHENFGQPLTVAELAKAASMSESNFFRAFKKQIGVSPVTYLNDYRLLKASALLETTELRIGDIAAHVGFREQYYFARLFLKRFGVSPLKYRKSAEMALISNKSLL